MKAWRICIGNPLRPGVYAARSVYPAADNAVIVSQGKPMYCPYPVHVGTKKEFCLQYYSGLADLRPNEIEILLELECDAKFLVNREDARLWQDDSFMGSEAKVWYPRVERIIELVNGEEPVDAVL